MIETEEKTNKEISQIIARINNLIEEQKINIQKDELFRSQAVFDIEKIKIAINLMSKKIMELEKRIGELE